MIDYSILTPELALTALTFVILTIDLFVPRERKHWLGYMSVVSLLLVMGITILFRDSRGDLYNGIFLADGYTLFFRLFFPSVSIFIILMSLDFVRAHLRYAGEYYGLILFATLAMIFMTAAGELITAYISFELLNFCLYILASYARDNPKSNEAGIKYILLSAFSSAILLYGLSLLYGFTKTTYYSGIAESLAAAELNVGLTMALVLVIGGLGFKVAAVPFHMWTPDVYEGAPTPITAFIAAASKAAGFALLLRLFSTALLPMADSWGPILAILAAVTMTVGNLVAIWQRNIKRLLAYSSISQVGYLLVGMAALSQATASAVVLHIAGYAVTNLAAFQCIITYYNLTEKEDISDYAGMAERAPFLALGLSTALFSLAGMPLFAGFTTKFYLFTTAAQEGLLWLVGLAITNSLISLYYYLLVIRQMYISAPPEGGRLRVFSSANGLLFILLVGVFAIGLYPDPLVRLISAATKVLPLA